MTLKSFAAMTVALVSSCSATSSFANHERVDRYPDQSYQSYRPLGFYLGGGYGFGGNEVGRFADSSGEIEKVRGGGGLLLEGGLQLAVDPVTALRLTTGYQADGVSRLNGEFGAGVTAHTSVGYDCNISSVCAGDVEFDSALGYTLEYAVNLNNGYYRGYRYGKRRGRWNGDMAGLRLGLRFTGIEYTPRLANFEQSDIIDGTTLSAFVGVSF